MIIAIGGKIASGKNTVCDIIQDLCKKHNGPNFEQKAFAGKLKTIASFLTGVPVEMFEDQEFKKQYMLEEWNSFVSVDFPEMTGEEIKNSDSILVETTYKRMTYREFLQKLGTEAMRDGLHTNVWVNALFADYKPECTPKDAFNKDLPNWIITDMRFPNEMDAVVERKGITIRVVRPKIESLVDKMRPYSDLLHYGIPMPVEHPSETSLDSAEFDYTIVNDSTIEELVKKVKEILEKEGII